MTRNTRIAATVVLLLAASNGYANPLGLSMARFHEEFYTPGAPLEIAVTIEAAVEDEIKALGIYEVLPDGWRFASAYASDNQLPAIVPQPGSGPHLEFAWIMQPIFPRTFFYVVVPPENAWGTKEIRGVLEYRIQEGPYLLPETVTVLYGPDEQPPSLVLRGEQIVEVLQDSEWEEPGYTALDSEGQDISSRVVISGEVRTDRLGVYRIHYSITSESGARTAEAERIVRVVAMTDASEESPGGAVLPDGAQRAPVTRTAAGSRPATVVIADATAPGQQEQEQDKPNNLQDVIRRLGFPDLSAYRPISPTTDGEDGQDMTVASQDGVEQEGLKDKEGQSPIAPPQGESAMLEALQQETDTKENMHAAALRETAERRDANPKRLLLLAVACAAVAGLGAGVWFMRLPERRKRP